MYSSKCSSAQSHRITTQRGQNLSFTVIPLTELGKETSVGVIVDEHTHQHSPLVVKGQRSQLPPIKADAVSIILDESLGRQPFILAYEGNNEENLFIYFATIL